jgi:Tfp pilus assembly protein PilO
MSQTTRDSLIILGVLAVLGGTATVTVYLPQHRKLQQFRVEIVQQQNQLTENATKAAVVPEMVRQVEGLKHYYRNFDRRLPQQKELGGFLREISTCLSEEKFANQFIEPGRPTRQELFHNLPIILRFKGSYTSLANFLKRLDRMERLTRVQKLTIGGGDGAVEASERDLNVEVLLSIYFTES